MHRSRRTLLHAPEMEDDISHIESHPITVAEIFSSSFYLSSFSNFELNIFQILKSIGHENGKRNIETQGQATVWKKIKIKKISIFLAFMSDIKKKLKNRKKSKIFPKIESKNIDCVKQNLENLSRLQKSK